MSVSGFSLCLPMLRARPEFPDPSYAPLCRAVVSQAQDLAADTELIDLLVQLHSGADDADAQAFESAAARIAAMRTPLASDGLLLELYAEAARRGSLSALLRWATLIAAPGMARAGRTQASNEQMFAVVDENGRLQPLALLHWAQALRVEAARLRDDAPGPDDNNCLSGLLYELERHVPRSPLRAAPQTSEAAAEARINARAALAAICLLVVSRTHEYTEQRRRQGVSVTGRRQGLSDLAAIDLKRLPAWFAAAYPDLGTQGDNAVSEAASALAEDLRQGCESLQRDMLDPDSSLDCPDMRRWATRRGAVAYDASQELLVPALTVALPPSADRVERDLLQHYQTRLQQPAPVKRALSRQRLEQIRRTLRAEFPWATEAVDEMLQDLLLPSLFQAGSLRMTPLLLVGNPGCGKTRLARRLGEELRLPVKVLPVGGGTDDSKLLGGTNRGWAGAQASMLVDMLVQNQRTDGFVVLDEIDKARGYEGEAPRVLSALLTLTESETAKRWEDVFLRAPLNLSHVHWVATSNAHATLPKPLLSRFRCVLIPTPQPCHLLALLPALTRELETEHGLPEGTFEQPLDSEVRSWRVPDLRALRERLKDWLTEHHLEARQHLH